MRRVVFLFSGGITLVAAGLGTLFVFSDRAAIFSRDQAEVRIGGATLRADVADDPASRQAGLSGRFGIAPDEGMVFFFDEPERHAIWMKGMRFPIDIFWVRDGRIISLRENVPPAPGFLPDSAIPEYRPGDNTDLVIETAAGFAEARGIAVGDGVLVFRRGAEIYPASDVRSSREREMERLRLLLLPGSEFFIEHLRQSRPIGSDFHVDKLLSETDEYKKHLIFYRLGDLRLSGVMNVPIGNPPSGGWPALVLNHGLIHPSVYFSGRGSRREQDFFSRRGYVTIHPDYRGLGSSDPNPLAHHDFYVGYTLDVVGLIDALQEVPPDFMNTDRIGMWGHSMGGGIVARAMALDPRIKAFVLFAPISADAEENFYELKQSEVEWLRRTYGPAGAEPYRKISPIEYFAGVSAPVQLHHGEADRDVPIAFSKKMHEILQSYGKSAEFFRYPGEPHEFVGDWRAAAHRALEFFDRYVKNAP